MFVLTDTFFWGSVRANHLQEIELRGHLEEGSGVFGIAVQILNVRHDLGDLKLATLGRFVLAQFVQRRRRQRADLERSPIHQ